MKTIKGPGIFLAQFAGDEAPFNSRGAIGEWAAGLGYTGVQIPSWDGRFFDLAKAADSAPFIDAHIIQVTERAVDDFADGGTDEAANRRMLGIEYGAFRWRSKAREPLVVDAACGSAWSVADKAR